MTNKTLIADLRKKKGWTQEKLAEECGLSVRTVQRLESGVDGSLETLRIIAEVLDVSVSDLFETHNNSEKEKEIDLYTEERNLQLQMQQKDKMIFKVLNIVYLFVMVGIGAYIDSELTGTFQTVLELVWVVFFLVGFVILRYLKKERLMKKYPLTQPVKQKNEKVFWWNDKVARPVLMIFWSVVIPLLFIMKYALHLF